MFNRRDTALVSNWQAVESIFLATVNHRETCRNPACQKNTFQATMTATLPAY